MFNWLRRWRNQDADESQPGAERRAAVRHSCDLHVNDRLIVSIGTSAWPAVVSDLSTSGIGLIIGIRHDPGTTLPLDLYCTASGYSRTVRVRIVRTMRLPDGHWFCGCSFDEQLDQKDLSRLL